MSRTLSLLTLSLICLLGLSSPSSAQFDDESPGHWVFGLGGYNIGERDDAGTSADLRVEYRVGYRLLKVIRPFAGVEITSNGSFWGGIGGAARSRYPARVRRLGRQNDRRCLHRRGGVRANPWRMRGPRHACWEPGGRAWFAALAGLTGFARFVPRQPQDLHTKRRLGQAICPWYALAQLVYGCVVKVA